jgi:hypothetical protein
MKSLFDKLNINENNSFYFYFNKKLKTLAEKQLLKKLKKHKIEYSFGYIFPARILSKYHRYSTRFGEILLNYQLNPNYLKSLKINLYHTKFRN